MKHKDLLEIENNYKLVEQNGNADLYLRSPFGSAVIYHRWFGSVIYQYGVRTYYIFNLIKICL